MRTSPVHELSLCGDLMEQVLAIAKAHHAKKIVSIIVRIGPLSGIEPMLLESAFSISRAGTLAEEAQMFTETLPIRVQCNSCGAESKAVINNLICGSCGDFNTKLLSGDELILARVELETADASPIN
ncbi:MAG: hydrogenase maturation nickel metallochaperone HypA [Methylovulum sp.]|nr:hydrogenase maturation nickel metallochaperone HypA [Methylovulum sp.]